MVLGMQYLCHVWIWLILPYVQRKSIEKCSLMVHRMFNIGQFVRRELLIAAGEREEFNTHRKG